MASLWRFVRGALGTAITWATAWSVGGLALLGLLFAASPGLSGFISLAPLLAALFGASGFTAGLVFSGVLATVYRRARLDQLDLRTVGAWGAGAGLILPSWFLLGSLSAGILVEPIVVVALLITTVAFGASTASGTVALAQASTDSLGTSGERTLLSGPDLHRV